MDNSFNWKDCYISYINLAHRADREQHMQQELARVGLKAVRTQGIMPNEYMGDLQKVQVMWKRGKGAVGCHFSQVKVMERALEENKSAFVMEDDLIFCSDLLERLDYIEQYLNKHEWDIFFLGGTFHKDTGWWHKKGHSTDLPQCNCDLNRDAECTDDPHIMRTYGAFSTHAYIVNKNSIEKVLKYLDENVHLSMGIDWILIKMQPQIKAFCFVPGCIIQKDNMSDIGHGITRFSGFASLGAHWFADKMQDFDPLAYDWGNCKIKNNE